MTTPKPRTLSKSYSYWYRNDYDREKIIHLFILAFLANLENNGCSRAKANAFDGWRANLIEVYDQFECRESVIDAAMTTKQNDGTTQETYGPIKIAVLDTGYDARHWSIKNGEERIIKKCCAVCLDNPEECKPEHMKDDQGHGTHIAGLLLDLTRDTQLIIVKLYEGIDEAVDDEKEIETAKFKVAKVSSAPNSQNAMAEHMN